VFIDGLNIASSNGDGYSVNLKWATAYPTTPTNKILYNIWMSNVPPGLNSAIAPVFPEDFFLPYPTFASTGTQTNVDIVDLIPGQMYHFGVRAAEYDPANFDPSVLIPAYNNLSTYPQSLLATDISATATTIPLISTESFPDYGVVRIGGELVYYDSVDYVNNLLFVPGGTNGGSTIVDQGGGNYYTASSSNIGSGTINNLTLVNTSAPTETWTIKCDQVLYNNLNQQIPGTARFSVIGSSSGSQIGGQEYFWVANGVVTSNTILSFGITETALFRPGDYFIVKVLAIPAGMGGRGYNNTIPTMHDIDGYDGYVYWDPNVIYWPIVTEELNTRVYECWNRFDIHNIPFTITDGYHQKTVDLLTTNLSVSDADNVGFPAYDFAGYHRTDPVMLLSGACVGSYIGGYMFCADGYSGVGQQLRGLNIQDVNNQRQEVLLSTTGEPALFVSRQWTGITCKCMLPYNEYPENRCRYCFPPETLIRTETGLRPINTIKIGDKVLSSDGLYYPVNDVYINEYDGYLKSITTTTTSKPILATPEHPFVKLGGAHQDSLMRKCGPKCNLFIKRGDGISNRHDVRQTKNKRWQARIGVNYKKIVLGTFDTKELANQAIDNYRDKHCAQGHELEWHAASHIEKGDWLVPKWNKNIVNVDKISIPQEFLKNTKLGSKRNGTTEFDIDNDFLWIAGLYIAEGCAGQRQIYFALHKNEVSFQEKVVSFFTRYGFNSSIRKTSDNGVVVAISGSSLPGWFRSIFGTKCYNKHIPEIFMSLPNDKVWSLINGINDGDGTKAIDENEITQTSEILALQLVELLHRCGKQPILRTSQHSKLTPKGNKRKLAYCVNWDLDHQNVNRKGRWKLDKEVLAKVKNTKDVYYKGLVYNLEVGGDHTYVVQNTLVHNCYGTGFIVGWQQYFNPRRSDGRIMVRFDPVVDDLLATDSGLESSMNPTCWTLTVPTLKDRDFLIRFDVGGNEEFRYEILNVTRNKLMFGMEGMQKFAVQRIRKTDPIYQVRTFRDTSYFPTQLTTTVGSAPGAFAPHIHTLTLSEQITSLSQVNQITGITLGHAHTILAGVVQEEGLGHTHQIVLPDPSIYPTNLYPTSEEGSSP